MSKKTKNILIIGLCILIGMAAYTGYHSLGFNHPFGKHGSASELEGNNIVISIFVSDKNGTWEDTKEDRKLQNDMHDYLGMATDWLTAKAQDYDKDVNFIYDWNKDPDLLFTTKYKGDLTDDEKSDEATWKYIDRFVDYKSLQKKYDADNVLFMVFLDTPASMDKTSCTRMYYEGMPYPYEICYIYAHCDGDKESPATIAHEMLHAYGAPDLYLADKDGDNYGISKKYVKKLDKENSNDIMYRTYNENNEMVYDKITNEFTEIDAYYVGLSPSSKVVKKWGFDQCEHAHDK